MTLSAPTGRPPHVYSPQDVAELKQALESLVAFQASAAIEYNPALRWVLAREAK